MLTIPASPIISWRSASEPRNFPVSLIASNASIEPALKPVKLVEGIGEGGGNVGSRLAVQPFCLD
jgi:hypothetical protein